jgi:hypothetical protein
MGTDVSNKPGDERVPSELRELAPDYVEYDEIEALTAAASPSTTLPAEIAAAARQWEQATLLFAVWRRDHVGDSLAAQKYIDEARDLEIAAYVALLRLQRQGDSPELERAAVDAIWQCVHTYESYRKGSDR